MALRCAVLLAVAWAALVTSAEAQLAATGSYRLDALRQGCIQFSLVTVGPNDTQHEAARCRVSRFGAFATLGDVVYYRAIYCLTPHHAASTEPDEACRYCGAAGLAIFVADKGSSTARLLVERAVGNVGLIVYDEPAIVTNQYGTLLHVKIRLDGTGHHNESEYYLLRNGAWHQVDGLGWLKSVRVLGGLAIWKGVWPDLATMTARIDLYRAGDGNCCPTGGVAVVTLALQGDAFAVTSVRFGPPRQ